MHLLHHRKQAEFWFLCFILITSSSAGKLGLDSPCDSSMRNCRVVESDSLPLLSNKVFETTTISSKSSDGTQRSSNSNNVYLQNKVRATPWPPVPSTTNGPSDLDNFGENLKLSAIVLAAIALGLGMIRVCLMFCKSSSNNRQSSTSPIRRHRRIAAQTPFKPDLPPAYSVAIRDKRRDEAKPPSYDDLPPEQRQAFTVPIHDELQITNL